MKNNINIQIIDTDNLYIYGIKLLIQSIYKSAEIQTRSVKDLHKNIDILFFTQGENLDIETSLRISNKTKIIALQNKTHEKTISNILHSNNLNIIEVSRKENISSMVRLIKTLINHDIKEITFLELNINFNRREQQLMDLLQEDSSNKNAAYKMGLSEKTVSTYKRSIMKKLNISKSVDLYRYLLDHYYSKP